MAAPTTTAKGTPTGKRLTDGHSSRIAFNRQANCNFFEIEVQPPGIDGGEPVDITTMLNTTWTTMDAQRLKTLTSFQVVAAYDPDVNTTGGINNLLNQPGSITVHYPDGSTIDFFGYLQKWEPQSNVRGTMPRGTLTIAPTNYDPANKVEAGPVLTSVAGT